MNNALLENNYLFIPQFIPFKQAKELAASFETFAISNKFGGDEQIPESNSVYDFPEFQELLCEKISTVGWLIGESVLPTYTYARVYHKNAELKMHKDRGACEISLTVNLDQDETEWPIWIKKPDGKEVCLNLKPGDAMLYLGCVAEHWRTPFQGNKHTQVFLHYVRAKGPNAKFAFDRNRNEQPDNQENLISESSSLYSDVNKELVVSNPRSIVWSEDHVREMSKYVILIENVLSPKLCSDIIKEYENSNEWVQATVGLGEEAPDIRGALSIGMSAPDVIEKNESVRKSLDTGVFERVTQAMRFYLQQLPYQTISIKTDSGYDLLKYTEGKGYLQHIDNFTEIPRTVSCSMLLNDDFEGADFCFFDGKYSVKPTLGSALFFPSTFSFPHQVNPVTKGTRYSIVTWFR